MASYKTNAESCDMYHHTFLSTKLRNIMLGNCIDFFNRKTCAIE